MRNGNSQSGVYTVYLQANRSRATEVFCDMDTDGGGWLVGFHPPHPPTPVSHVPQL